MGAPRTSFLSAALAMAFLCASGLARAADPVDVAVAPQYSSAHVYVAPATLDRFVASLLATFGGSKSQQAMLQITPTASQTQWQAVTTPAGLFSVFAFTTPIPYPFGLERTGYLVTDMDAALRLAREQGADVRVAVFPDPIGRDAVIEWPGGVLMQLYWHKTAPVSPALISIPENRVYVSADRADAFVKDFVAFAHGRIASNDLHAPGAGIGRPGETYRRVRIDSNFGRIAVLVTDGHLPFPFGHDVMGYEVANLAVTLCKAEAAGARIVVKPYRDEARQAALVQFPGGYIAEIHSAVSN